MPEYDRAFGAKLAEVAGEVEAKSPYAYDARRVVAYLSRVSVEITLKALLERAGKPVREIRARSHDLRGLLEDLGACQVEIEIGDAGRKEWVSAARLRAVTIDLGAVRVPIGHLICAEDAGASPYPNQIRYGDAVVDMAPQLLADMAQLTAKWAQDHWDRIRYRPAP